MFQKLVVVPDGWSTQKNLISWVRHKVIFQDSSFAREYKVEFPQPGSLMHRYKIDSRLYQPMVGAFVLLDNYSKHYLRENFPRYMVWVEEDMFKTQGGGRLFPKHLFTPENQMQHYMRIKEIYLKELANREIRPSRRALPEGSDPNS